MDGTETPDFTVAQSLWQHDILHETGTVNLFDRSMIL